MTPAVNLHIMIERFSTLSNSAYFDPSFKYLSKTVASIATRILDNQDDYPEDAVRNMAEHMWRILKFIQGSRVRDTPHETLYVLRKALSHWIPEENVIISNAALDELEFFLDPDDIREHISQIGNFDEEFEIPMIVRIESPEAFKHRPIFCAPLFHELGHFVDEISYISKHSMSIAPIDDCPDGWQAQQWHDYNLSHRKEYFSDLFCACYCGSAGIESLSALAPDTQNTDTHPSTDNRKKTVTDFLNDDDNLMVSILQQACFESTGKELELKFHPPNLTKFFDDAITYRISSERELFGIFPESWIYLHKQLKYRSAPWITPKVNASQIESIVNGLVEKSIRNYEICERWKNDDPDED